MLKKKDNKKKFLPNKDLLSLNYFKKKRLPKNLKLKRKNKNSLLLKQFKRQKLPLQRKLLLKPILQE
jgi:hypothetical protein